MKAREITCDRDGCPSLVRIEHPCTDQQCNEALRALGWEVVVHESGDKARDGHHCEGCRR